MLKPLSILAILAAVLLNVGCGGSDATLSKAEFITQADAICKKTDSRQTGEIAAYEKLHLKNLKGLSSGAAGEKIIIAVGVPSILKETEELKALGAPPGEEKRVKAILDGIEAAIKKVEQNPASIEEASGGPFTQVNKLAREYGFRQCSEVI